LRVAGGTDAREIHSLKWREMSPEQIQSSDDAVRTLHDSLIVVDTHVDTILQSVDLGYDLTKAASGRYMDLPTMQEGNLSAIFFGCCVDYHNIARGRAASDSMP
jgi:hypothetical protein